MIQVKRYHDISCGHRVVGHEGKCRNLHGHNYRITFTVEAREALGDCDRLGRVLDFGVIKEKLCVWLEANWDHRMLLWDQDPDFEKLKSIDPTIVAVPFNPTAEHLGMYLMEQVGPATLATTRARLVSVEVEETRKCSAVVTE